MDTHRDRVYDPVMTYLACFAPVAIVLLVAVCYRRTAASPALWERVMFGKAQVRVRIFRRLLSVCLRLRGYSSQQIAGIQKKIGDGKILEWLAEFLDKHGATILAIIKILLPLILAFAGPPELPPHPDAESIESELLSDDDTEIEKITAA